MLQYEHMLQNPTKDKGLACLITHLSNLRIRLLLNVVKGGKIQRNMIFKFFCR